MDLYGTWPNPSERELIWIDKRAKLQAVEYTTNQGTNPGNVSVSDHVLIVIIPTGPITVQKGWWFSAHEQWKYLELPYNDVPINRRFVLHLPKTPHDFFFQEYS